jgi:hypothetical protein
LGNFSSRNSCSISSGKYLPGASCRRIGIVFDGGEDDKTERELKARLMLDIYIEPAVFSDKSDAI